LDGDNEEGKESCFLVFPALLDNEDCSSIAFKFPPVNPRQRGISIDNLSLWNKIKREEGKFIFSFFWVVVKRGLLFYNFYISIR